MSKQQHTPGPWFTSQPHATIYIEARLRGSTLQEVAAVGPTEADNGYGPQQWANARLIAAAPELLEALIDAEHWVSEFVSQMNAYTISDKASESAARIRAAIAKARGES